MKRFHKLIGIVLSSIMIILISGCGGGGSSDTAVGSTASSANVEMGVLSLSITDAPPKLGDNVTEVNIAVIGIEYNHDGNWTEATDFVPQTFNLLDLQNGRSLHLGDIVLPAGHYTEIRFKLAAPEKVGDVKSNPDCNITFADGSSVPLFVPSGGQSGYKGKGAFDITADAKIEITADFDVHKSIVVAGNSGKYLLKPVIRLMVNELSGEIDGTVVDVSKYVDPESLVVYAYKDGVYDADEVNEIDGIRFPNAVSSSDVNMTDGSFTLSFLGEGNYTLITALYAGTSFIEVVDREDNVEVFQGETAQVDLNTSD
jgi:hypothetical protein